MRSLVVLAVLLAVASATSLTGKVVISPRGNRYLVGALIEVADPKDYKIGKLIGQGGFGKVYSVTMKGKKPMPAGTEGLAVKVLSIAGLTPTQIATIQNEFNIQRTLSAACPGVVLAVESWTTTKELFMVMEKMGGGELNGAPDATPPVPPVSAAGDVNVFLNLAKQMVEALKCVHAHGYVHRDVKMQNWLVSTNHATVKLADFGESFDAAHALALLNSPLSPYDKAVAPHATGLFAAPSAFGPGPAFTEMPVNTYDFARRKSFDTYGLGLCLLSLYYGETTLTVVASLKGSALSGFSSDIFEEVAHWKTETSAAVAARFAAHDTAKHFKSMPALIRKFILDYVFERVLVERTDTARPPFGHWTTSRGSWVPPAGAAGSHRK